jgi:small-conductance mechanosensitive channel
MAWLKTFLTHLDEPLFVVGKATITPLSFVVFAVTVGVALLLGNIAQRAIRRYFRDKPSAEGIAYALERMVKIGALALGIVIGLQNAGINLTALAAVGAMLSVGIGFGLQGVAQNFVSGIALLIERPVEKGDFVIIGDTVGEVDEISMRATRIVTRDAVTIIVPNNELMTTRVVNMSRPDPVFRARLRVGVAYGSDTDRVRQALVDVAVAHDAVMEEPSPEVLFRDFGPSSLDFDLAVWLQDAEGQLRVMSELRFAIDAAFRRDGIVIPFPQRDVHIKRETETP